jgi:hypothetical protein
MRDRTGTQRIQLDTCQFVLAHTSLILIEQLAGRFGFHFSKLVMPISQSDE